MNPSRLTLLTAISFLAGACAQMETADLQQQVGGIEQAFAATMAERDHAAFSAFLSEEAVFLEGTNVLRGRQQVAETWARYFESPGAPFSWEPEQVVVLDSGQLALSTGPVFDPDGRQVAVFTSIWRLEAPGVWRIVFDRGNRYCE